MKIANNGVSGLRAQVASLSQNFENEKKRRMSHERELAHLKAKSTAKEKDPMSPAAATSPSMTFMATQSRSTTVMVNVKWSMKASKLDYHEIKTSCDMLEEFVTVQGLSDREAKFILFQSLEGSAQNLACGLPKSLKI